MHTGYESIMQRFTGFLRGPEADDIFISYSRRDASPYVVGLDAALAAREFLCLTDKRGTEANEDVPASLLAAIRACKTFVLVATPGACEKPEVIAKEATAFAEANGTARIIIVSFGEVGAAPMDWRELPWYAHVKGKTRETESPKALATGEPSKTVVDAIATASDYMKNKDRLRRFRSRALWTLTVLGVLILAAVVANAYLLRSVGKAQADSLAFAEQAASSASAAARSKEAAGIAQAAEAKASEAERAASAAAAVARDLASFARFEAHQASEQANDSNAVADSRALAIEAQAARGTQRGLALAVRAVAAIAARGLQSEQSALTLREHLAWLPRLEASHQYTESASAVALSPDGRHVALLTEGNSVRVYAIGTDTSLGRQRCGDGNRVAISEGGALVAVARGDSVVVCSLGGTELRRITLPKEDPAERLSTVEIESVALSPNGRFLAMIVAKPDTSTQSGKASYENDVNNVGLWDIATGKQLLTLSAAKRHTTVSFSAGGDIVVGTGGEARERGVNGDVQVWAVAQNRPPLDRIPTPTQEDFAAPQTHALAAPVSVAACGRRGWNCCIESGIWKRDLNGRFLQVMALPAKDRQPSAAAFSSDGTQLAVARLVPADGGTQGKLPYRVIAETWATDAQPDLAHAYLRRKPQTVGFGPGDRLLAAAFSGDSNNPRTWDAATGNETTPQAFQDLIAVPRDALFIGEEARFVVFEVRGQLQVRDVGLGTTLEAPLDAKVGSGRSLRAALSSDGRFLAVAGQGFAVVYKRDGHEYKPHRRFGLGSSQLPTLRSRPGDDGRLTITTDGEQLIHLDHESIRIWATASGRDVTPAPLRTPQEGRPRRLLDFFRLSPSGRYLAVAYVDECTRDRELTERCLNHKDGRRTSELPDRQAGIDVLEMATGTVVSRVARSGKVTALRFSPSETQLLSASDDMKAGLSRVVGSQSTEVNVPHHVVGVAAFSRDGRYFAVGTNEDARVFQTLRPGNPIAVLPEGAAVGALAFSRDGQRLLTASDRDSYRFSAYWMRSSQDVALRIWVFLPEDLLRFAVEHFEAIPDHLRDEEALALARGAAKAGVAGLRRGRAR